MLHRRLELEPDEKPTESKPQLRCPRKDCTDNLFGYCQTALNCPSDNIDFMKCRSFKLRR